MVRGRRCGVERMWWQLQAVSRIKRPCLLRLPSNCLRTPPPAEAPLPPTPTGVEISSAKAADISAPTPPPHPTHPTPPHPTTGDEILSAKVEDINTRFLLGELRALGWRVNKVMAEEVVGACTCLTTAWATSLAVQPSGMA